MAKERLGKRRCTLSDVHILIGLQTYYYVNSILFILHCKMYKLICFRLLLLTCLVWFIY